MSLTEEWLDIVRDVITSPGEFYSEEKRRNGFGFPFKFAALTLVIAGIIQAVRTVAFTTVLSGLGNGAATAGLSVMAAVWSLVVTVIGGLIGLIIGAGIAHIFVMLLGGEETYSDTLAAFGYATAISPITALVAFVPIIGGLVNILLGLYGIYIQIKGVEKFQSMTTGRAALAVLLPIVIVLILVVLIMVTAGVAFISAMAA